MKNSDNIEQLFKETFERFEADVNPNVWNNIQHSINSAPAGGAASSAAKFTIGKIVAGAVSVAAIAGSVWYFTSSDDNKTISSSSDKKNQTEISSQVQTENTISTNQLSGTASNAPLSQKQTTSSIHSSASDQTATKQYPSEPISDDANNAVTAEASYSDNSASASQPSHGKTQEGPINQPKNSLPKPQNNNPPADNQNTEQAPIATIVASMESGDAPLTVTFSNQGVAYSLNWDFGDGSVSTENIPSHIFTKPGNYTVTLSAKNSAGSAFDKKIIEVKSISGIGTIPNTFTPNYDGENDFFSFEMKNIASIEVTIMDINGAAICSWTNLDGKWDGKMKNGTDAPKTVYFYTIQATGTDGVIYTRKGSVTLL